MARPTAKTIVLDPSLGLILQPNEQGQYPPGALRQALNVHVRDKGLLQPFPAPATYRSTAASDLHEFRRFFPTASKILGAALNPAGGAWELRWVTSSGATLVTTPEVASFAFDTQRTGLLSHRGRYYFLSTSGVLSFASEGASSAYLAGFVAPRSIIDTSLTTTNGQAYPAETTAAYRAIFVRKGSDGSYIKMSPPSMGIRLYNPGGVAANMNLRVSWSNAMSANLLVGDFLELYRTPTADEDVDPGASFYLCKSAELTSTDLTNTYVNFLDNTPDGGLGSDLYTNPSQPYGELAAKYPPPRCNDVCSYKGHAFYVATALPGYRKVRVPGAWGALDTAADQASGIGRRIYTATRTATSSTLTGLSSTTGLTFGMLVEMSGVAAGTTITSVNAGASTVTMSAAASSSATGSVQFHDRIYISGGVYSVELAFTFPNEIPNTDPISLTWNQTLDGGGKQYGLEVVIANPWYAYGTGSTSPTVKATNGANYSPPLPELNQTALPSSHDARANRIRISEKDQPEAVAATAGSELLVGYGTIYRVVSTTDAVWAFCSDGLFRIDGDYPEWRVDPVDSTLVLAANTAVDVLQGVVWAYTNRGLVAIGPNGIQEVSEGILGGPLGLLPGAAYFDGDTAPHVSCDESTREVHVMFHVNESLTYAVVFNTLTRGFTVTDFDQNDTAPVHEVRALAYAPFLRSMIWDGSSASVIKYTTQAEGMERIGVEFQPVAGVDAFTLSRWIDCTYRFAYDPESAFEILPSFSGASFPEEITVIFPEDIQRPAVAAVPRELDGSSIGLEPYVAPGFSIAEGADQLWAFKGLALRFVPASERLTR